MIVVYSQDEIHRCMVERALEGLPVDATGSRALFEQIVRDACCAIVVLPDLGQPSLLPWVQSLHGAHPHLGWIVLTRFAPDNVAELLQLRFQPHLVWLAHAEKTLGPAVTNILQSGGLGCLSRTIRDSQGIPPELRDALTRALLLGRPPRTVAGLGRGVGLKERRVRYLWSLHFTHTSSPREFIDWVLLARALRLRMIGETWSQVAAKLSTKEDTLRAVCARRVGLSLSELEGRGPEFLQRQLGDWWTAARSA